MWEPTLKASLLSLKPSNDRALKWGVEGQQGGTKRRHSMITQRIEIWGGWVPRAGRGGGVRGEG